MDSGALVQAVLGGLDTPVFLAGFDARRARLTVHVPAGYDIAALRAQAKRAADKAEEPIRISVRAHRLRKLAYPRSLEHWLTRFDVDQVVHDPTMIVSRGRGLLLAAKSCRAALGDAIKGLFFDPDRRTLFVLERGEGDAAALQMQVRTVVRQALDGAMGPLGHSATGPSWTNVQVVAALPLRKMIPIDRKSASLAQRVGRTARRWFAPIAVALALAGTAVPAAAKVDAETFGRHAIGAQATATRGLAEGEFGILAGLSVFADNARQYELDMFASAGLQRYFGEGTEGGKLIRLARKKHRIDCSDERSGTRARDPNCVGTVGGRPREPKTIGQVPGGGAATPGVGS
jgi:hypothetical protein